MDSDEFLSHYGVKGMKWGVRRSPAQLARAAKERAGAYRKASADAKAATARTRFTSGSKDAPKNLSDDELNKRISRMETEKKYNELNSKTVSAGQAKTNEIITSVGTKTIKAAATGLAVYGVKKAVEAKMGKDAAQAIKNPKP